MRGKCRKKLICLLFAVIMMMTQLGSVAASAEDISALASSSKLSIVLTLGADLSEEQKAQVLQYFGIDISQVQVITITNQDEKDKLGELISAEKIGSHTYSCALVRPANAGGIQVKTANMNYVTSNMIAGQLSTSGVYNCEVLTAAPFEVSGTGALTGVMMAYEAASGVQLDEEKKELANVELITTGNIADTVGQDQATLIVNDIKIHIVRDQISGEQEVYDVVDQVVEITETAAAEAAANQGKEAPAKLGEVEHEKLYDFSYKFSQMDYDYAKMQPTLERVTHNITTSTGIDDPIVDTFTTINEEQTLSSDSILLGTNDEIWGDDAIINATNSVAVADRPAEPINVFTGDVTVTSAGGVKADEFITGTNIIAYKDVNGSYALMDLNGKLLTESIYQRGMTGRKGFIEAKLNDGSEKAGILAADGSVVVEFKYDIVRAIGSMWAWGVVLTGGATEEDYDYTDYTNYYYIDHVDFYYIGTQGTQCVGTLTRDECYEVECFADYVNVQARSGVITTYDSTFTALQTTDSLYNFSAYDYDSALEDTLEEKTGYYVSSFYGKYAKVSGDGGYGIIDRYGNVIIPPQFDSFVTNYADESYEAGGYFASEGAAQLQFVTAGGTVTGSFPYGIDSAERVRVYGMSATAEKSDGGFLLLSGDGVETDLGTAYSYMSALKESKGMLWMGDTDKGLDLIDWHGNVLLSGSRSYSMSANGNYIIAQDGYTSSTLYMVNDAEPVDIANSAGGAQELEIEEKEAASLEVYTGDPTVEPVGTILAERFIDYTDLLAATNDGEKFAIMDVTGRQLTNPQFGSIEYNNGWLIVYDADTHKCGMLSMTLQLVIPLEYDYMEPLNESWAVAYTFKEGTEADHDFQRWSTSGGDQYFQIDTAKIHHIGEEEVTSVEVTREQFADAAAMGEYLNIEDRTTGAVTTYDASFTAVASVNYTSDFGDYDSEMVRIRQLEDQSGYDVGSVYGDGYATSYRYDSEKGESYYGVIDLQGEEIVPMEYEYLEARYDSDHRSISTNGYFCVRKNDMVGYVTKGGVVSCELKYESDKFTSAGMGGVYEKGDGTYMIVAADGTESGPYPKRPSARASGKFYQVSTIDGDYQLIDWHGNVIAENFEYTSFSGSGKYFFIKEDYQTPAQLYTVDGAALEGIDGSTGAAQVPAGADASTGAPEGAGADASTGAQTEASAADSAGADVSSQEQTEAPAADASSQEQTEAPAAGNASAGDAGKEAASLLQSASVLLDADFAANKGAAGELLKQAKQRLETDYPNAAAIIDSAVILLDTDSADGNSVKTLISSALSMLP